MTYDDLRDIRDSLEEILDSYEGSLKVIEKLNRFLKSILRNKYDEDLDFAKGLNDFISDFENRIKDMIYELNDYLDEIEDLMRRKE
jgi:hypothetical protein